MAVMDAAGRLQAFRDMLDEIRKADTPCNTTKAQLQAAVDAIDDWLDANAAMNSALPAAARNGLTTPQKAMLLMAVIARRYRVGA
jgi:hypothetical protein